MANRQKDDTDPSRYMKRRLDLAEADNIINEMLIKKSNSLFVPTITHQQETSIFQNEQVTEQAAVTSNIFIQ
jgi:hypothetical protein